MDAEAPDPLVERLRELRTRMDAAARRAGRRPSDVRLVMVTKAATPAIFERARAAGVQDVGESRVQAAAARVPTRRTQFRWHLVGHLQANKVRAALPLFDVFHGVDSLRLLQRIDRLAGELGCRPALLLQVNLSGEATKKGWAPDAVAEAVDAAGALTAARVEGLMTMAPATQDPRQAREVFRHLARLRDELARRPGAPALRELSMGMSNDFELAVEEGATWIRVGRRLVADAGP